MKKNFLIVLGLLLSLNINAKGKCGSERSIVNNDSLFNFLIGKFERIDSIAYDKKIWIVEKGIWLGECLQSCKSLKDKTWINGDDPEISIRSIDSITDKWVVKKHKWITSRGLIKVEYEVKKDGEEIIEIPRKPNNSNVEGAIEMSKFYDIKNNGFKWALGIFVNNEFIPYRIVTCLRI
ncbi:hypothetical protein [Winogradskyella sp.]|uniref:hypothetical protein n=1 Tax=Winogradskyella sp. TaxID=1883156 RepID=UPI00261D942C|nr:hypothetical protein [Winogradskyella sp.]